LIRENQSHGDPIHPPVIAWVPIGLPVIGTAPHPLDERKTILSTRGCLRGVEIYVILLILGVKDERKNTLKLHMIFCIPSLRRLEH